MTLSWLWLIVGAALLAALWKWRRTDPLVGETAYVGSSGLSKNQSGEVTCLGSIRQAKLATHARQDAVEAGAAVTIIGVADATLIVRPQAGKLRWRKA